MQELDWGMFKPVEVPPSGGDTDWGQFQPVQAEATEPDWTDFQPIKKSDSPLANAVRGSGITEAFETNPVIAYGKGAISALPLMSRGVTGGSVQQLGEAFGGNAPTGAQLKQSEINAINAELRSQGDIIANLPEVAKTPQSARYQYAIKNIESLGGRLKEIEQRPEAEFLSDFESSRLSTERLGAVDIAGGGDFGEPSDVGAEMIAKTGRATFLQAVKEAQALAPKTEEGSGTRFASDLGQATMMMVPAIIGSVVTKSPSVGLGLMGYQVKPLDYAQRREQGLLPDQSDLESTIVTASEILTEKTPLDLLLSGKGFWKKLLTAAPAEGLQEGLQSAVESLINAGILNKEMTFGEAWSVMQKPETWKQMGYATALGAAMGATFTGVLHPLTREKAAEPAPETSLEPQPSIEPPTTAVEPRQAIITPDALIPEDTTEQQPPVPATAEEQPIRLPPRAQADSVDVYDVNVEDTLRGTSGKEISSRADVLMREGVASSTAEGMFDLSSRIRAELEENTPAEFGATQERQLQELRSRLSKTGANPEEAVRAVWGAELANASPGLRQAIVNNLALSKVPSTYSQRTNIEKGAKFSQKWSYSQLARGIESTKQPKAQSSDWKAIIAKMEGVKKDEIEAVGLNEWLDMQQGSVTKDAILDFVRQNGVHVKEVMLGSGDNAVSNFTTDEHAELRRLLKEVDYLGFDYVDEAKSAILENEDWATRWDVSDKPELVALGNKFRAAQSDLKASKTKFSNWQLPGGENYRELLLTLPTRGEVFDPAKVAIKRNRRSVTQGSYEIFYDGNKLAGPYGDDGPIETNYMRPDAEIIKMAKSIYEKGDIQPDGYVRVPNQQGNFRSSHFDEPNILAHVRFNERTDADGKRVLFIEEVQSDWAQKGRKEGFKGTVKKENLEARWHEPTIPEGHDPSVYSGYWEVYDTASGELIMRNPDPRAKSGQEAIDAAFKIWVPLTEERKVPSAPFVTKTEAWAMLAMKRMIRYGSENGFDKIAWTTGTQQADRYDLSKHLNAVRVRKDGDNLFTVVAETLDKGVVDMGQNTLEQLPERIGKELADKISTQEEGYKEYTGLDLKVGGEGMKAFYDQMLPQMVNKYVKKWGGKVSEIPIQQTGTQIGDKFIEAGPKARAVMKPMVQLGFDITPAMRDAVMQGQPLFQVKPDGETVGEKKEGGKTIEEPSISTLTQSISSRIGKTIPDSAFVAVEHPEGFAPAAEAVQAAFGKRIVLIRNNRPDIVDFNGVVIQEAPNTIFINEDSNAPFVVTTGHELTHHLRRDRPELYKMLRDAAVPRMQGTEKYKAWLDAAHQRMGIPQATVDTMEEELIADFIGENWQNREFWEAMQKNSPSQFRRLIKAITDWLNKLLDAMRKGRVASQYFKEVEALRDEAAAIFAEYAKKPTDADVKAVPAFSQRKFGPLEFPTKDIESAYREASKGLSTPRQALEGAKEWFAYVGHGFTRHYVDMPNNATFSKAHEILRQYEAAPEVARAKAAAMLREVLHGLNPKQYDLLTRKILLDDLAYRQSIGHALPYGFTEATLKQAKSAVDAAVKKDAAIEQALTKRNQFIKRVTDKLVKEGILKPEQTQNPAYFHHQVLVHARAHELWAKGARRLKKPRPGYAKKAHGSTLDINANYLEAEFAFLSEALLDLRTKDTLRKVENAYDITQKLQKQAKEGENWKDLIPEGYEAWQPEKGNLFYSGKVIGERAIEHLLDKAAQSVTGVDKSELEAVVKEIKEALIVGGKKKELIIPSELARTLERMRPDIRDGLFDWLFAKPLGAWKVWTLINPRRVIKYNTNNMSGDLDAVVAGNPAILKEFGPSIRELWNGMTNKGVSQDYWDAMDRGVFDSGLTIQEIPDVNKLRQFEHLFSKPKAHEWPPMIAMRAWRVLKDFTQFRENWMRYAAYQYALKRLNKGDTIEDIGHGATHPDMFNGLDKKDTAALWSRNLVGDYGDISHFGQGIRRYAIPFYSFQEINIKRYLTLINNAYRQGIGKGLAKSGVVGAVAGARITAWLGIRMFMVYMLMQLWNHLLFPDEEEELNTMDKSRLHVIVGRDEDGKVRVMRLQGALSDFLGWVGAEDAVSVLREMEKGRASWSDFFKAIGKAPINKVAGGLSPVIKTPFEYASGRNFYPDVFNPRSSQDKNRDIFRLWSLEHEYDWLTGKPSKGYGRSLGPEGLLYYTRDPNEGAYYEIQKMKRKFMEGKGIEGSTDFSTPKSRLMREYVMAKRYKDAEAEERIIKDMTEMGVKNKDIKNRLERARPLSGLSRRDRNEFIGTLSPKDKELLRKADRHWMNVYAKPIEATP